MNRGVCSKIKQIRLEKSFSRDYMATKLGLTKSEYAKIEKQQEDLTLIRLIQISEILDTNPTHLFEEVVFEYYLNGSFQLARLALNYTDSNNNDPKK
ncbi:MAG: XRE family transcriptional regulator [Pedobacter sp.]|nr:MAG: XRE family transcriptional regulator [Pedobacter sp.]